MPEQPGAVELLYQDDALLVCVKPRGIDSQKDAPGGMPYLLRQQTEREVFPVHRLDRETEGLMVYACSSASAAALSAAIQKGMFRKEYLAVVRGKVVPAEGRMEDLLLHDRQRNRSYVVDRKRKGVRDAALSYRVLAERGEGEGACSLVHVLLHTGRTHQIRVQFSSRKHPLLGDGRYGGGGGTLQLWSVSLSFPHPVSGERMRFQRLPSVEGFPEFTLSDL